ncbi:MAG TPA: MFS transporter [Vicinamibacterales bacterium]|nr:MFS transporter [Vicinamibacterales bacterium]
MPARWSKAHLNLAYATLSFTLSFAAWGLISAFAGSFRTQFNLSAQSTALLVAVPVLLGAVARLPLGMLTDRLGGRVVHSLLFLAIAASAAAVPSATSFNQLLVFAFFLGVAGASFAVGVGFTSRWFAPGAQGTALGIFGLGNMGHSAAVFLGPVVAANIGRDTVFYTLSVMCLVWGAMFFALARDAPVTVTPATFGAMLAVLTRERLAWALSAFYFLTFGGFVAFSVYLPTLLRDEFALTAADAGFRTAGFVVLATLMRPIGGVLSDHIGGARVLSGAFAGVLPFALLLMWPSIIPFTVGALGCAALLGAGNGAVFKLVPELFPRNTATVTGLVGAMGGLGGFFPPLVLGFFREQLGAVWPGFGLLAAFAAAMWLLNARVFLPRQRDAERAVAPLVSPRLAEQLRAGAWASMATALLAAAIVVGSRNLQHFDPALVIYTFAVVFATWGIVYHYAVWLNKPPTRRFFERTFELLTQQGLMRAARTTVGAFGTHILGQTFIARRSRTRWLMHQFLFWGCVTAVMITFPLVFGWIHFGSAPDDQMTYVTYVFGFPVASFRVRTVLSWVLFHGLDFSAVLVLAGVALALWRRLRDQGALTLQEFSADFLPLVMLFAISVTGLALTASAMWMRGSFYGFLAILHAITVIGALLYLPFGKFFHIFQRPAQLGVKLYQAAGAAGAGAICARCQTRYASQMQIADLERVLPALGFDYRIDGPAGTWQGLCPPCKRTSLASAQLRHQEIARGTPAAVR